MIDGVACCTDCKTLGEAIFVICGYINKTDLTGLLRSNCFEDNLFNFFSLQEMLLMLNDVIQEIRPLHTRCPRNIRLELK